MQVKDIMTSKPACCSPQTSVSDAAKMMVECDCGEIPVLDNGNHPIGVITDRDIACRVVADERDPQATLVGEVMTRPVYTASPDMSLPDCCRIMEGHQIRRLPVVDSEGKCCGIVSQADIALHADEEDVGVMVRDVSLPSAWQTSAH